MITEREFHMGNKKTNYNHETISDDNIKANRL